ncbi:MAG: hypothetical protein ACLTAS_01435 [Butyribacter sp.]
MIRKQIEEIAHAIDEMKSQNSERWTIKQMESQKKRLEEQIKKMTSEERKDDLITFEELGIDSIMVDEAHAFKNLAIFSKMNVSGITGTGSQRAMDMFLKCEYINELNGGRALYLQPEHRSAIRCARCMSCRVSCRKTPWSS